MAPLYKRYIPPKPSTAHAVASTAPANAALPVRAAPKALQNELQPLQLEKKRKRERSEQETAERKAKKLRKKGIEATVESVLNSQHLERDTKAADQNLAKKDATKNVQSPTSTRGVATPGDFSHVKQGQKRHKLEKEARKARIQAEKVAKAASATGTEIATVTDKEHGVLPVNFHRGRDAAVEDPVPLSPEDSRAAGRKKKRKKDGSIVVPSDPADVASGPTNGQPTSGELIDELDDGAWEQPQIPEERHYSNGTKTDKPEPDASKLKKRRHKLESVLSDALRDAEVKQSISDHSAQKHNSILDKFQKAAKRSEQQKAQADGDGEKESAASAPVILRDLEPIPQPEKAPTPDFIPDYSALPAWLAKPVFVSRDESVDFATMGLDATVVTQLKHIGFENALPVQKALIPLLLPPGTAGATFLSGAEPVVPDIAVSAATGSGKTIAYLLPIISALRKRRFPGRLRALVVVPTHELVSQVASVARQLAQFDNGVSVAIGTASGAEKLSDEQQKLTRRTYKHDPEGYAALMAKARRRNYPPDEDDQDVVQYIDEVESEDPREEQRLDDAVAGVVDHVPHYVSAIDLLICTPGRLLEHINSTLGFDLSLLEWLVLDEADKLLDARYDGFLEILTSAFKQRQVARQVRAQHRYSRAENLWHRDQERRVRKILLSATMTRDISKLATLELFRPKMLIVGEDTQSATVEGNLLNAMADEGHVMREDASNFELPPRLVEYCVPVGDGTEKPLFLVELLSSRLLPRKSPCSTEHDGSPESPVTDEDSDEDSDVSADSSSELSGSTDLSEDEEALTHADASELPHKNASAMCASDPGYVHPSRAGLISDAALTPENPNSAPTILIFTSSNEAATRLSHLLRKLKPQWSPWISTLAKAHSNKRKRAKDNDKTGCKPSITICTDRAARGLDRIDNRLITHVIQYDVPRSLTSYIHRVGRTARVGRDGAAWTLYTHREAAWFLREIARTKMVRRSVNVEKVRIEEADAELREAYREILEDMREEVYGRAKDL